MVISLVLAAAGALLLTGLWAFAMFGPIGPLNVIALIPTMFPLMILDSVGVAGLGTPNNGFFLPTPAGYRIAGFLVFGTSFVVLAAWLVWSARRARAE